MIKKVVDDDVDYHEALQKQCVSQSATVQVFTRERGKQSATDDDIYILYYNEVSVCVFVC